MGMMQNLINQPLGHLGADAFDHEVWHDGKTGDRVLLLFDFWHPDLEPAERQAIIDMFGEAKEKGWLKDYE